MDYFQRIYTLVGWAPGRWKQIELSPRTIVVGKNGTGKSRLGTSLSFLVTGKAPGEVFGKEDPVALAADIAELFPEGIHEVYGIDQEGRRTEPPSARDAVLWAHPIRAISSALRGSKETSSTFFAPFMVSGSADIEGRVPEMLRTTAVGWKVAIPKTVPELQQAIESAKNTIYALGKKIDGAETILVQVPATDGPLTRGVELQALVGTLERQCAEFSTIRVRAQAWEQWIAQRDRLANEEQRLATPPVSPGQAEEVARGQAYRIQVQAQYDAVQATLIQGDTWATGRWATFAEHEGAARKQMADRRVTVEADVMLTYSTALVGLGVVAPKGDGCPACGGTAMGDRRAWSVRVDAFHAEQTTRMKEHLHQQLAAEAIMGEQIAEARLSLEQEIKNALAPHKKQEQALAEELIRVDTKLQRLQGEIDHVSASVTAYNAAILKLKQDKVWFANQTKPEEVYREAASVEKLELLQGDLRQARDQYAQEMKRQGAAEQITQARRTIAETQAQRGWFVGWLDALRQIHGWLVADGVGSFQQRVQAYLPADMQFRVILEREGGGGVFRFGLADADGAVHSITYGASRGLVLYALAAACLDLLPAAKRPSRTILLLDEERSIDPEHLVKLMRAIQTTPHQVVVTTTHFPAELVEGWTVVDLNTLRDDGVPVVSSKKNERGGRGRKKRGDELPLIIGTPAPVSTTVAISSEELDLILPNLPAGI